MSEQSTRELIDFLRNRSQWPGEVISADDAYILGCAAARLEALERVVEGTPKTKDGVSVVGGDVVYAPDGEPFIVEPLDAVCITGSTPSGLGKACIGVSVCYSTAEAARAAQHGEGVGDE